MGVHQMINAVPAQTDQIKPLTLSFVGPMNYPATKNLRNACAAAVNNRTQKLTLLISS
jgi:hypothetical protein